MTETEIEVNNVLTKASGDLGYGAILLSWTIRRLKLFLKESPSLKHWLDGGAPTDAQALHRPAETRPEVKSEAALAAALEAEEMAFHTELGKLGVSARHANFLSNLARMARRQFRSTLDLLHGGMVKNSIDLLLEKQEKQALLESVQSEIANLERYPHGSPQRQALLQEQNILSRQLRECGAEIIRCNEVAQKGLLVLALGRQAQREEQDRHLGFRRGLSVTVINEAAKKEVHQQ